MGFTKIELITSMNRLGSLNAALSKLDILGMTMMQAIGCGVQKGTYEYVIEQNKEMELLPKEYIMLVVEDGMVDKVVETIKKELYTGHIGDGKIFLSPVSNVIKVRTGEEGADAMR